MSLDMSLARGLDYYTGIVFEAVTEASAPPSISPNPPVPSSVSTSSVASKPRKPKPTATTASEEGPDESTIGVGSIAGGGRYDNLVGMFSEAAGGRRDLVPCVGVSIGVERVYSIMEMRRRGREEKARGKETEVYVMNFGKEGLLKERMGLAKLLRDQGIKVGHSILSPTSESGLADYSRPNTCTKKIRKIALNSTSRTANKSHTSPSSHLQRSKREQSGSKSKSGRTLRVIIGVRR